MKFPTDLKTYKEKKKYEKVIKDIEAINNIFVLTQKALSHYNTYIVCQEIIGNIETNRTFLESQKLKLLDLLKEKK